LPETHPAVREYIGLVWTALSIAWVAGAFATKRALRAEPAGARFVHTASLVAAFALLFTAWPPLGPLRHRFVPDSPVIGYLGLLLTLSGAAFALWARVSLGGNWSSAIEIKQDHALAQRGPYAVVRHPIYTGILLAMLGTALAIGTLRGLAAVGLALMAFLQRAGVEEAFLTQQFGARYTDYKREVKKIIPLVW
jgi:protein-S-isoprenylcysteine O-methyltransferase Ste14